MFIKKIRPIPETNSSSTHALIISPDKFEFPERVKEFGEYGWDFLIREDPDDILRYILTQYYCNITASDFNILISDLENISNFYPEIFDEKIKVKINKKEIEMSYIDHQSIVEITPRGYDVLRFLMLYAIFISTVGKLVTGNDNAYESIQEYMKNISFLWLLNNMRKVVEIEKGVFAVTTKYMFFLFDFRDFKKLRDKLYNIPIFTYYFGEF